jgi:hypothetical protein
MSSPALYSWRSQALQPSPSAKSASTHALARPNGPRQPKAAGNTAARPRATPSAAIANVFSEPSTHCITHRFTRKSHSAQAADMPAEKRSAGKTLESMAFYPSAPEAPPTEKK